MDLLLPADDFRCTWFPPTAPATPAYWTDGFEKLSLLYGPQVKFHVLFGFLGRSSFQNPG